VSDEQRSCSQKADNPEREKRILGDFVVDAHSQCLFNIARSPRLKLTSNFFLQMREYRESANPKYILAFYD